MNKRTASKKTAAAARSRVKRQRESSSTAESGPDCIFIFGNDNKNVKTKTSVTAGKDPDTTSMEHNKIIDGGKHTKAASTWKLLSIITIPPDKESDVSPNTIIKRIARSRGMPKRVEAAYKISEEEGLYFFVDKLVLDPKYFTLPGLQQKYKDKEHIRLSVLDHMKKRLRTGY